MENDKPVQGGAIVTIKGCCMGYLSDVVVSNGKIITNK
jgi:hypothetical protein